MSLRERNPTVDDEQAGAAETGRAGEIAELLREGWRAKSSGWLRRYGVAECAGITCALVGSFSVRHLTGSNIAAAYGGAWGESIGYASVIVLRDYLAAARVARAAGNSIGARGIGRVGTGLLTEFGPAAVLDTLAVRPFAMAVGMRLLGPGPGLIAGKIAADILFYLPVIFMYERRKRLTRDVIQRR